MALLECFDVIYMPVLDDEVSQGKLRCFEEILRSLELRDVMQRLRRVHVPVGCSDEEMAAYAQRLREEG